MNNLQAVELKKVTSDIYLQEQLNSKSHIRKNAVFKHRIFPLI
jgi:hypothetical protein